jgi:hypothetical protein
MPKRKRDIELHAFVDEDMARMTLAAIEGIVAPHARVAISSVCARQGYWFIASDCTKEQFHRAHDLAASEVYNRGNRRPQIRETSAEADRS